MSKINERTIEKFSSEVFTSMIEIFDLLLNSGNVLEEFLMKLTEEQKEELYGHPLIDEYDLLP